MSKKKTVKRKQQQKDALYVGIGIGVSIFVLGLITFAFVKYWPISKEENKQRLLDVANMCNNNEESRECKKLAQDYNITFEYCHALYDIPTLQDEAPIYIVARLKSFTPELPNYMTYSDNWSRRDEIDTSSWYPFYGCADTLDAARSLSGPSKLNQEGARKALKSLSDIPRFEVSGDTIKCSYSAPKQLSHVWSWIPDSKALMDDWESFLATHKSCDQIEALRQKANKISGLFNAYANNYIVQSYYEAYDKSDFRMIWISNQMTEHIPDDSITDFAQVMEWFSTNDSFVAKKTKM